MADRIQLRRDTAANWTSANPTLAQGEMGIETDTSKIKVGDGSTAWTSLGYFTLGTTGYATTSYVDSEILTAVPSQASQSGKYLTTNGTATSWGTITIPAVAEYSVATNGTTANRTLNGDSGWQSHLSTTFTTTQSCTILCFANFSHGYESGAVDTVGRFQIDGGTVTDQVQIFKQGFGSNMAFGAHSMSGFFTSVSAGSHTITCQVRNAQASTTAIMNYFDNGGSGDRMWVLYK